MRFFDGHCDTASEILNKNQGLLKNNLHLDIQRLEKFEDFTQVFAVFISPEHYCAPMERCKSIIENFKTELEKCHIPLWESGEMPKKSPRAILSLEGGEPIGDIADLDTLASLGIRMIAPTWNHKNRLGCGVMEAEDKGLTDFGKQVIKRCFELGIIPDISHCSVQSADEILSIAERKGRAVIASHSCAYGVHSHPRNLRDEQFLRIKELGGVVGLSLCAYHLVSEKEKCTIEDILRHFEHYLSLGGEDMTCFGADMDGAPMPSGILGIESLPFIYNRLCQEFGKEISDKITYNNAYIFMKKMGINA